MKLSSKLVTRTLLSVAAMPGDEVTITLGEAVDRALKTYPAVRVSLEQVSAAAAGITLARTAYLPEPTFLPRRTVPLMITSSE